MTLEVAIKDCEARPDFRLRDISFGVQPGQIIGVLGPNGSGKSSLLRLMAGLSTPDTPGVRWRGRELVGVEPHDRPFALMFQKPTLLPRFSVERMLNLPAKLRGAPDLADRNRTELVTKGLALDALLNKSVSRLSGGERQRVALGAAILDGRSCLLLDEPFASIDAETRASAQELLVSQVEQRDLAVVLVTHELATLSSLAETCVILDGGEQVSQKDPDGLFSAPASLFEARLAGYKNIVDARRLLPPGATLGPESSKVVVIPQDALTLTRRKQGAASQLRATVRARLPSGEYVVRSNSTNLRVLMPRDPDEHSFTVGEACWLIIDLRRVLSLEA